MGESSKLILYSDNQHLASSIGRYLNIKPGNNFICKALTDDNKLKSLDELVIDTEIKIDLFKDSILTLFPDYLINDSKNDDRSCSYFPRIFRQTRRKSEKFIESALEDIVKISDRYYNFNKSVKNEFSGELIFNDYDLSDIDKTNDKRFYLFNIQSGTKGLWNHLLEKFFSLPNIQNSFFIFYYTTHGSYSQNNHRINKDSYENECNLFGYNRFFRDFIKEKKLGFEINIDITEAELKERLKINEKILTSKKFTPKKYFNERLNQIKQSLKAIYGKKFIFPFNKKEELKLIAAFYIYNKNKHSDELIDLFKKYIGDIDIKGNDSHSLLRNIEEKFADFKPKDGVYFSQVGGYQFVNHFRKTISALLRAFISFKDYKQSNNSPTFLFIDDNPEPLLAKLKVLDEWFPNSAIYYAENFSWKEFYSNGKLVEANLGKVKKINVGNGEINSIEKIQPDFIVIDLDYNGQLVGVELLIRLNAEIRDITDKKINLIVLSRYEEPYIIRNAINNGALFYVTKANFLRLIYKIFQLNEDKQYYNLHRNYQNWHKVYKLNPSKLTELQASMIKGDEYDIATIGERWKNDTFNYTSDYQWIKKLPKADLHCHIGSCLGPNFLPKTAILVLAEKFRNDKENRKIEYILDFLLPVVTDPFLNEVSPSSDITQEYNTKLYKQTFLNNKDLNENHSIFHIISHNFKLAENNINPETAILDPSDTTLERLVEINVQKASDYFRNKWKLRQLKVTYDEVMLFFILLLSIRTYNKNSFENFFTITKEFIDDVKKNIDSNIEISENDIDSLYKNILTHLNRNCFLTKLEKLITTDDNLLKFLQSAHSIKRCLPDTEIAVKKETDFAKKDKSSLFNYLRGCEYGGSAHLQTKSAIYLAARYIVDEYAKKENIRYIGLRCAVDGYAKLKMQTKEEALEALLRGFNHYCHKAIKNHQKIHVDIILTAKRHKSLKEFEDNVHLALKYRYGLDISESENEVDSFFKILAKVVSFDLAGLEKGNRPSKFYQQFLPLLRNCFPITIHAGEEDDYESIWEAIYLVQSQRIGHGLTLRQNKNLLNIVRERHIAVELCPISNLLTQGKIPFNEAKKLNDVKQGEKKKYFEQENIYPLRQYLDENIDVTINTDNPFVNDATLSQEFLVGAKLVGGLTKWEILRLIKNGFKAASISKNEKRKLMNEIDEEIYELLLNED